MKHSQWAACFLAGLTLWVGATPVEARRDGRDDRREDVRQHEPARRDGRLDRHEDVRRREPERQEGISLDEAVARVRRETGGRVLSAEARGGNYRIKVLLPNGAVRVVNVDARRGNE